MCRRRDFRLLTAKADAYYSLGDPNSKEFRYPPSRSLLKTVHRTVFYAADPLGFKSRCKNNKRHSKECLLLLAQKKGFLDFVKPLVVPKIVLLVFTSHNFDHCASFCSLYRPPDALATSPMRLGARVQIFYTNQKEIPFWVSLFAGAEEGI